MSGERRIRALLVDDSAVMRSLLRMVLDAQLADTADPEGRDRLDVAEDGVGDQDQA